MYPKFKSTLMALSVALGILAAGYGLGEPPSAPVSLTPEALVAGSAADPAERAVLEADAAARAGALRRGAVKRHMAMPYVSIPALMPRQES